MPVKGQVNRSLAVAALLGVVAPTAVVRGLPLALAPLHFAAEDFEEPYPLGLDDLHAVISSASANTIELPEGDADLAVDG